MSSLRKLIVHAAIAFVVGMTVAAVAVIIFTLFVAVV